MALASGMPEDLRVHLEPMQIGVGTKHGAEAVVHAARQCLHRDRTETGKVLVTLDLENAFNRLDRIAPGLVPWTDFCYK